jgi:hypothetical protein
MELHLHDSLSWCLGTPWRRMQFVLQSVGNHESDCFMSHPRRPQAVFTAMRTLNLKQLLYIYVLKVNKRLHEHMYGYWSSQLRSLGLQWLRFVFIVWQSHMNHVSSVFKALHIWSQLMPLKLSPFSPWLEHWLLHFMFFCSSYIMRWSWCSILQTEQWPCHVSFDAVLLLWLIQYCE